ncbi:Peptidoglycan glycosyltransferase [Rhodopseudomonas palustris HaA2]|uniref:Peptidoglycan glycosyltransferase n=1 Tax=Rhodopseudomonas palustris (strain HaA2) TaxID=316058 RepID=Q2IYL4_RHOP2|nr:penicillin-binding protein 2 [Rhodopseudomonas palustris]ABD06696.1 Peptidoglycan glycosyltransferase [Rhodopseudomonas palustris HaA2]
MTEPSVPLVGHHVNWRQRLVRSLIYGRDVDRDAKARARVGLAMLAFAAVYGVIAFKLTFIAVVGDSHGTRRTASQDAIATARPDIVDRNGTILATDVKSPSLFGEPRRIIDQDEAVELLTATLPDLETPEVRERLASKKGFVWLKREITPRQQADIKKLGIPGIGFLRENRRIYPTGTEVSHLIGLVNIDNQGIAGIEKWLDHNGLADLHRAGFASDRLQKPVELAVDIRVQHALRDELLKAKDKYKAKAASGLVSNVNTGEIVAMVSLPDFDPNNPREANDPDRINRLTTGVYEMGSTFKTLTLAMALDSGKATLNSMYDARGALRYGKFAIHDTHPLGRAISLSEVFTFSSNVGAARIALSMGVDAHKAFLKKVGQLDRLRTELPESASPIVPKRWGELNTITISFGHGVAVAPLQAVMGINAMVNGGYLIPPTFHRRSEDEAQKMAKRVVKKETSDKIRYLMRLNAEIGTARTADQIAKGYYIGGKTGTSEKVINGRYAKKQVLNSFTAVLPADHPQFQVLIMLDEPKPLPETHGFITSGWNAVPTGGKVIERIAPLLGIEPRFDLPPPDRLILASSRAAQ